MRKHTCILVILLAAVAGCGKPRATTEAPSPPAPAVAHDADLSKPFATYAWQSSNDKEPLTFVKMLAHAAGGTWVGIAPHPLEEVKWMPNTRGYGSMPVSDVLAAAQKAGSPI